MREVVSLPESIVASLTGGVLTLKGPKGTVSKKLEQPNVSVGLEGNAVSIFSGRRTKKEKKVLGSLMAHTLNMVKGVTEGHLYRLKACFTHFPITVTVTGDQLVVKNFLGEKVPRKLTVPAGVNVKVEGSDLVVESADKEAAGKTAALMEQMTRRTCYDTRVFGDGIYITIRNGKEVAKA